MRNVNQLTLIVNMLTRNLWLHLGYTVTKSRRQTRPSASIGTMTCMLYRMLRGVDTV